ncbi:hypothetical protein BH10BAC4_BH10BAC4_20300 [soil metagenome]
MKPLITNLNDALTFQLEGMHDAEKRIQKYFPSMVRHASSIKLRNEMSKYLESASDKRVKLKRIFSYLLCGPFKRKNIAMEDLLADMKSQSKLTTISVLRDRINIANLQSIIQVKISVYQNALICSEQLNLQTVTDLLEEILSWERETYKALTKIALDLVSRKVTALTLPN